MLSIFLVGATVAVTEDEAGYPIFNLIAESFAMV